MHNKTKHIIKFANLVFFTTMISCIAFAQSSQKDTRSKNRRFADSMYYVHTIKKQEQINKQTDTFALKKLSIVTDTSYQTIKTPKDIPSSTLYQHAWVTERVKTGNISLKDLPDEITIRLCGKNNKDKFHFPCKGVKTSTYGWRWGRAHTGVDIALNVGDSVHAAFDGVVRVAKYNGGYGNMVLIRHYNNLETLYGHLSVLKVKHGQKVKAGDIIGLGGSTGRSTGPHLHFECRLLYACIDPEWILDINNSCLKTRILKIDKSFFGIASQLIADNTYDRSKLTKVNRYMEGSHYVGKMELKTLCNKKETKQREYAVINNEDKSTWRYYKVKIGDTIEDICARYRIKKEDFLSINSNISELKEEQRVRVR